MAAETHFLPRCTVTAHRIRIPWDRLNSIVRLRALPHSKPGDRLAVWS
jgi:hypothetical protein